MNDFLLTIPQEPVEVSVPPLLLDQPHVTAIRISEMWPLKTGHRRECVADAVEGLEDVHTENISLFRERATAYDAHDLVHALDTQIPERTRGNVLPSDGFNEIRDEQRADQSRERGNENVSDKAYHDDNDVSPGDELREILLQHFADEANQASRSAEQNP